MDIQRLSLADQAFQAFRTLLSQGHIRAGQLISMPELIAQTQLPMAPVREAVKKAEAIGLVEILPKRGVLVLEATSDAVESCFHLRYLFDQEGARILASRSPTSSLHALRDVHEEVRQAALVGITPALQRKAMDVDWQLHKTLANALGNPLAKRSYDDNVDRISIMQQSRPLLPDRIVPAMHEHLLIIDAILEGTANEAMLAVRRHFRQTLGWWGIVTESEP
ncbi:GntR family transcriptional regulator [Allopusillimonas ginsengisoli]|uniref:GntR family transcriptional regulator n=1 Tax=Allopusillimonas ginsengisoli TaxID=453575 RepID=UPI0010215CA2|nr:GntR family transcriptional regulator [Allopusillimonas ginsengisoli]TEA80051.1 GntR family transcriptional regulator [Allopusillimonas ginsengisoli]